MKTKVGISVGLVAAAAYFTGLFSGYIPLLLSLGYVLIAEQNRWLKVSVIKALIICLAFSSLRLIIGFIPDIFGLIASGAGIFEKAFTYYKLSSVMAFINNIISLTESVILFILGVMALNQKSFSLGIIDSLIKRHFPIEGNDKITAIINCPSCGAKLSADEKVCGTCGAEQAGQAPQA
jgi:uncharacterized membrane protein